MNDLNRRSKFNYCISKFKNKYIFVPATLHLPARYPILTYTRTSNHPDSAKNAYTAVPGLEHVKKTAHNPIELAQTGCEPEISRTKKPFSLFSLKNKT